MAKKLNPNKTTRPLPDGKRVTVADGQVKLADRTPKLPLKTG